MKFLFEMFPIILFFIAFKIKGIYVATAVAIIAGVAQIAYSYFKKKQVEPMLWVSLAIITIFGGATLILHNENFIKIKPTILYLVFSGALFAGKYVFKKNFIKLMMQKQIELKESVWDSLCISWGAFFVVLAAVNLFVAFNYSTNTWVNFKLFGIMGLMLAFIIVQAVFLAPYIQEKPAQTPKEHD